MSAVSEGINRWLFFLKQGTAGVWQILLYCYMYVILNVYCDLLNCLFIATWIVHSRPDTDQYVIMVAIAFVCKVILFCFLKSKYIWKITASNHYLVYFLYDSWYLFVMVIFLVWLLCKRLFLTLRVALNLLYRKTVSNILSNSQKQSYDYE